MYREKTENHLLDGVCLVFVAGIATLAILPLAHATQIQMVLGVIAAMLLLRMIGRRLSPLEAFAQLVRILVILLAIFLSIRYLVWRTFHTLPTEDPLSFVAGALLYLAEIYALVIMMLGAFVTINPLRRSIIPLPEDTAKWPSVDVLIPTYNESEELLEVTLLGALHLDYPRDKINIYLLDDGGTLAKRQQVDLVQANAAHLRHRRLQALCQKLGVHYLTREKNESAKAGNINSALPHIHGDLVLIIVADHVLTTDFLRDTVGWFDRDSRLFLVQTPHFFINPDPIEKNLRTYEHMPSEQEMFYNNIQRGLDFWNSSFFCGSAALLRRRCLDEVGGVQGVTVTEDAETAVALHARGYHSAYIWKSMMAGLQPESFVSLVKQRVRWAQGMTQLLMLRNPLRLPGLSWYQRLSYLNCMLFWLFPFPRIIFLLAPLAYLLLGLHIYNVNLYQVMLYALPHLVGGLIITDYLYGNARWIFVSEFYELLLSLFMIKPLIQVMRSPRSPSFQVTAKGEVADQDHISPLIRPVYWMLALVLCGIAAGIWRYDAFPQDRDIILITLVWACFNLCMLLGALGALVERQQQRAIPRIPFEHAATLYAGGKAIACATSDLSVSGVGVVLLDQQQAEHLLANPPEWITIQEPQGRAALLRVQLQTLRQTGKQVHIGFRLIVDDVAEKAEIVRLVHGDSEHWRAMLRRRNRRISIMKALWFIIGLMLRYFFKHFQTLLIALFARRQPRLRSTLAADPATNRQILLATGVAGEPIARRRFEVAKHNNPLKKQIKSGEND